MTIQPSCSGSQQSYRYSELTLDVPTAVNVSQNYEKYKEINDTYYYINRRIHQDFDKTTKD